MTREEAIAVLAKIQKLLAIYPKRKKQKESVNEIDTAIGMAIEALKAEPKWIPCSERLPSESDDYLCTIPLDAYETYTRVLTFHKGRFYEDDDEWGATYHDDVLAWMPLPKPYKGGVK